MSVGPNPHQTTGGEGELEVHRRPAIPQISQAQRQAHSKEVFGHNLLPYNMPVQRGVLSISKSSIPATNPVFEYQKFVANFNRRYALAEMRQMLGPTVSSPTNEQLLGMGESHPYSESDIIRATHWKVIQDSVRQNNVWGNVRRFLSKIKGLLVKKWVPIMVRDELDQKLPSWWDDDTEGWNPWRLDVIFNDVTQLVFNIVAIFLFSTRVILYKVDMGAFPALYIIVLCINAYYRCNTKVLTYHHVIVERRKIIEHYLVPYAILDCTLIYLSILQICRVETSFYRMIIFLKIFENYMIINKLIVAANIIHWLNLLMKVVRIYIHVLTIIHVVALAYMLMVSKDKHPSWMDSLNYTRDQDHWISLYVRAFYWATSTLTYCVYGDITPQRTKQVIIVFMVQIVGIAVVAYWLNGLQTIFSEMLSPSIDDRKNMRLINRFLQNNKVEYHIQKAAKYSMHNIAVSFRVKKMQEENQLIETLSPWIKDRLLENVHLHPMMTMPLWNRLSTQTIKAVATQIQRKLFYSTEIIIEQDEVPDKFYMLRNGRIYQTFVDDGLHITKIGRLDFTHGLVDRLTRLEAMVPNHYMWIGLDYTIKQLQSPASVISKGQSIILSIQYQKVMDVLKQAEDKRDYQSYCLFRDQMRFGLLKIHQVSCLHCPGADHNIMECPYYHLTLKKKFVILKYLNRKSERRKYKLIQRVLQPELKGKNTRRTRFPWIRIGNGSNNIVIGTLSSNNKQNIIIDKYKEASQKQFKQYHILNPDRIEDYLTTQQDSDLPYNWTTYFPKYNVSRIKINKN